MPPRRSSQKSSPKVNPTPKRRLMRRSRAARNDPPEASPPVDAVEIDGTQMESEGSDRDGEEAEVAETAPLEDVVEAGEAQNRDADNASRSCMNDTGNDGERKVMAKESDLGEEVAADADGACVVNRSNLGEEVSEDDQKLENGGDKDLGADGTEGASGKENLYSEAAQVTKLMMSNDLDAEIKHDSNAVEDGDPLVEGEDEDNQSINGDSQLSCNPAGADAKHNLVEDESPAAKNEVGAVGEEEGGNCEDEEEEYDYEESENDGDDCELSEEVGEDYEESEDGEGRNEETKEGKSSYKSGDPSEKRRMKGLEIHIAGLNKETVEDDLTKVFGKFGEIQSVRIIKQTGKKFKVFAFIQYSTVEQANNAVSELKDGVEVRGSHVKVSTSWENSTVFMDNICKSWTKEHVLNTLKRYGIEHIEEVQLPKDPENEGQIKGFAILNFSTHMDAVAAHQRLGKADVVFGCDRSAEVAFMRNQVPSSEDLLQIKAAISRRRGGIPKAERGGSWVKKSSGKMPRNKTEAHAKSLGAEKEHTRTEQASSSKGKGRRSEKKGNGISQEKRKPTGPRIPGSKSNRTRYSVTENRIGQVPSKSTTTRRHVRNHLPLERDDRGKRKMGHGYDDRPSKYPRGNLQSTPRNVIRSPRRNPRFTERSTQAHSAISGSKRHRPDMEPHAGYVEPAALKQIRRKERYLEPDVGNYSKRHLEYLKPELRNRHQSRLSYLEPALENRHEGRASYFKPALENRHQSRLSYHEPTLENKHQGHVSYLEPSLGREALPHGGYLEPAARVRSHYDDRLRLRRDDGGYNNQISSGSSYARVSALPSYAPNPRLQSYSSRHEADSSRRGGGYRHGSYLPRR